LTRPGLTRRAAIGCTGAVALLALATVARAQVAPPPAILVVDRSKVLESTDAARQLNATETALREALQVRLDRVKTELETEERAITDARDKILPEDFARRGGAFDQRVRLERREAQERGERILKFLEESRGALLARLPEVLEELRIARGAVLIIDAAAAAAYDADLDVTADAVALFNDRVGEVSFEPPALLLPR
jgi:Skp family chaperone for outer membrane proteins